MRKGTDLFSLPIIAYANGERIDTVSDLIFDAPTSRVLGFLVDDGGLFSAPRVLPLESVRSIGADAVIIDEATAVVTADTDERFKDVMKKDRGLKGKKVMTEDGKDLGSVADLYFDETTGKLEGYEVSGGLFADAYSGRSFVPATMVMNVGEDVVFVPNETVQMMEEQTGGIKAALQTAGSSIQGTAQAAGEKAKELSGSAQERLQQTVAAQTVDQAVGKRAHESVRTAEGMILVAQGQVITADLAEQAKSRGLERELLAAANLTPADTAKAKASDLAHSAKGSLSEGVGALQEQGAQMWEKVKERTAEWRDQATQEMEERRIKQALGRPVTRVILDQADQVILNTGDLITNESIERARSAGVLDVLLGSVYTKTPEFSKDDMKVRQG